MKPQRATDCLIYEEVVSNGGKAVGSIKGHESDSDRIAEAIENLYFDIVDNVQGDEPFIDEEPLANLIETFSKDSAKQIDLASLMRKIMDEDEINNSNNVKVVKD
jgi:3-deoxy-manno-octulosonate cytidylyltransferase (CMP-KDO synthetase)